MAERKRLLQPQPQPLLKRTSAAQTHRVMADLTVQNALTVAVNAEVAMAAEVAADAMNAANVVTAPKVAQMADPTGDRTADKKGDQKAE